MIASEMIEDAVVKAGMGNSGSVDARLTTYGLKALNRVYPMVWGLYPVNDNKFYGMSVPILEGIDTVTLPLDVDVIRGIRIGDRCLSALDVVSECDKGWFWNNYKSCEPIRYVGLPNSETGQRMLKLIPAPLKDGTILIHGIRRCVTLTADSEVLLASAHQVIFHYLVAEFFDFNDDSDKASTERQKANDYFKVLKQKEEVLENTDVQHTPAKGLWE